MRRGGCARLAFEMAPADMCVRFSCAREDMDDLTKAMDVVAVQLVQQAATQ